MVSSVAEFAVKGLSSEAGSNFDGLSWVSQHGLSLGMNIFFFLRYIYISVLALTICSGPIWHD
ncbi:hypothetical protein YC2023_011093 [Brassica napus]